MDIHTLGTLSAAKERPSKEKMQSREKSWSCMAAEKMEDERRYRCGSRRLRCSTGAGHQDLYIPSRDCHGHLVPTSSPRCPLPRSVDQFQIPRDFSSEERVRELKTDWSGHKANLRNIDQSHAHSISSHYLSRHRPRLDKRPASQRDNTGKVRNYSQFSSTLAFIN